VLYTYPGDGTNGFYTSEDVGEVVSPTQWLKGVVGPYLFVIADGPWVATSTGLLYPASIDPVIVKTAILREGSASGPSVAVKTLDATGIDSANTWQLAGAAFIVPVQPLKANTTYWTTVTLGNVAATLTKTWTFKTGTATAGPGGSGYITTTKPKSIITGHLTKTKFRASAAKSVKLIYKISKASSRFAYKLSRARGTTWKQIRYFKRTGNIKGTHYLTVKKLFGGKARIRGRYRLTLYADSGKRPVLKFRIV